RTLVFRQSFHALSGSLGILLARINPDRFEYCEFVLFIDYPHMLKQMQFFHIFPLLLRTALMHSGMQTPVWLEVTGSSTDDRHNRPLEFQEGCQHSVTAFLGPGSLKCESRPLVSDPDQQLGYRPNGGKVGFHLSESLLQFFTISLNSV